ncbi:lytic transglycosylase domain-containing protein [Vibrio mediterranei]
MLRVVLTVLLIFISIPGRADIHSGPRQLARWKPNRPITLSTCPRYCEVIARIAQQYQVPKNLIIAVIKKESAFNPDAVSHKGAKGLMQLMDVHTESASVNPFHPSSNIEIGTAYLARLLRKYDDISLALAAYNAGEGAVKKYQGLPSFKETRRYVEDVLNTYQRLNDLQ